MAKYDIPKTPQAAPPNFYSQVGQMAASQPSSAAPKQGKVEADFLDAVTKLLKVLDKLSEMKPNGKDVKQFTDAAAQSIKDALKTVYGEKGQEAAGENGGPEQTADTTAQPQEAVAAA